MSSLRCAEHQACDAKFYCVQCNSLQCNSCENELHQNHNNKNHERLNLKLIVDEYCSINRSHPAIFYCSTCAKTFCYLCYIRQHEQSNGRKHKLQKFREGQVQSTGKNNVEHPISGKPIYPNLSSDELNKSTMFDENRERNISDTNSNGVVLLLDAAEQLSVRHTFDFVRQLKSKLQDPLVKCVSIIGNTGDGKSYTLNRVFFNGDDKFHVSAKSDSCTMGAWAALDENQQTLVIDTEGRLGLSQNDNVRNRLLLKILCISDIVIFRTRAPKLPNDMFQFLSDASTAFLKYFKKELENVMKNCKVDGPMSTMGPTLIVFHETQHTEVLRDHFQCQKTAVEQLKERFEKMNLTYDAYNSIEYVGIQTLGGRQTDFSDLKATITSILENNKIRSPRRLSVIFKALKALSEKFNHTIPPDMPSTLPDEFFTCCIKCLSCGTKCIMPANHQKENLPHQCDGHCSYNKELDNEIMKCVKCDREGDNTVVYGKLMATNDGLIEGLVRYFWSGFIIECPKHGEVYRSRRYWYGNNEPKYETRVEIVHVWPGDETNRLSGDVTPRKIIEAIRAAGSYVAGPTTKIKEMVADQIAPAYWVPNRDSEICSSCKLQFGLDYSKHHCRKCGYAFCDTCTQHRAIVPLLDNKTPERVCDNCYQNIQAQTLSTVFPNNTLNSQGEQDNEYGNNNNSPAGQESYVPNSYHIPMSRRIIDIVKNNIPPMIYDYPIEFINSGTRPKYWRPDNEYDSCFICKHPFNNTTYRLHHCRKCGECICDSCSPGRRPVPERGWSTPERVCKTCEEVHE